jgi:hypothetical protein
LKKRSSRKTRKTLRSRLKSVLRSKGKLANKSMTRWPREAHFKRTFHGGSRARNGTFTAVHKRAASSMVKINTEKASKTWNQRP